MGIIVFFIFSMQTIGPIKHGIRLKDVNYVQIHPTTFYSPDEEERSFLISESVRGEGAVSYTHLGPRVLHPDV